MDADRILREIQLDRDKLPDEPRFPFTIPAVASLDRLEFNTGATFLIGENGTGKSTLIEATAVLAGFNPEGGSKNFRQQNLSTESALAGAMKLVRGVRRERSGFFLRAETMFNVSTEAIQYSEYGWENLHGMSHGEAFLWVAVNRFIEGGLYILDEPEAALSPQRQLALLARIHHLVQGGSQFIISTHSPILMACPGATLYHLDSEGIQSIDWKETEHYTITRAFLQDPERMLSLVLEDCGDASTP